VNSGIAAYYYLRLLTAVYTRPADDSLVQKVSPPSTSLALALLITVLTTLYLGIFPGKVLSEAQAGAATFVSGPTASNSASIRSPQH
jgi:NADH-quinone oxidoreductase subunit N